MDMRQGTPSTLTKAIKNGLEDFEKNKYQSHAELVEILRQHVEEFIRNKLSLISFVTDDREVLKGIDRIVNTLK